MQGSRGQGGAGQEVPLRATHCLCRWKPSHPTRLRENCHRVPATPQEIACSALSPLVISLVTPLSHLSLRPPLPALQLPCAPPASHGDPRCSHCAPSPLGRAAVQGPLRDKSPSQASGQPTDPSVPRPRSVRQARASEKQATYLNRHRVLLPCSTEPRGVAGQSGGLILLETKPDAGSEVLTTCTGATIPLRYAWAEPGREGRRGRGLGLLGGIYF